MHRNRSANVHQFSMVPKFEVPRSAFVREHTHKTTIDAGYLYPLYLDEVLPGDTFSLNATIFGRLATPLYPIMDNMYLESFFFFVPNRLLWTHWREFNGQQANPSDSTSYVVPQVNMPNGGYPAFTLFDYFGLPTVGQMGAGANRSVNAFHSRAYNLIWNEWFRDENLQNSVTVDTGDGPDTYTNYVLLRRGKRADYFTSCLPWPQKGTSVTLPLGSSAPVFGNGNGLKATVDGTTRNVIAQTGGPAVQFSGALGVSTLFNIVPKSASVDSGLYADLSQATAATINQLRQSFQIQKLLERDARGGTRYTEIIRAHFGVISPDARLQRPEYLGGGMTPVNINPIAQNSGTGASGTAAPLGTLAAMGTLVAKGHGFTQSFTEHGVILGLVAIRADLTYQQGLHRMWTRQTRYDFYWPEFAALGEQAVLNQEIYCDGSANDLLTFGYQERWAEYRYKPSMITGFFRSTNPTPLDAWHLAQKFTSLPTLNSTFIQDTPPTSRVVAVGAAADNQTFLIDSLFSCKTVRPMPMYSVPGLIDHF